MAVNRLTFNTFRITPENREAVDVCRAVAGQAYAGALPVVLFGQPGGGKSHLIWSVLNEVRAGAARVGIALVLARDFPDRVRKLVKDPAPIRRAQRVLLLVDELELFRDDAADLEAVVSLFNAQNQPVLLASNVHPERLSQFSESFRALLGQGRLLELSPAGEHRNVDVAALQEQLSQTRAEREALVPQLERADRLQMRVDEVEEKYRASEQSRQQLEQRVAELEREKEELTVEKNVLLRQTGAQEPLQQELNSLRKLFSETEADAAAALAQQALLQGQLTSLRQQLTGAQEEASTAAAEAQKTAEQAMTLHAELGTRRETQMQQQQAVLQSFHALVGEVLEQRACEQTRRQELQGLLQQTRQRLERLEPAASQAAALQAAVEQQQGELQQLGEALEESRAEASLQTKGLEKASRLNQKLQREFDQALRQIALQAAEMDALRQEVASQVASAQIGLGELEGELHRYRDAWETVDDLRRAARGDVQDAMHLLKAGAEAVGRLERCIGHILKIQPPRTASTPDSPEAEATLFMALPEIAEDEHDD